MSDVKHEKPALRVTKDYSLFVQSEDNRPVDLNRRKGLVQSMEKYGYLPSFPLSVVRNSAGKLEIRDGQHRFATAQQLSIPVWYVIVDEKFNISEVNQTQRQWTPRNYVECFAAQGISEYTELLEFADEFGLSVMTAAGLMSNTISGNNVKIALFDGRFKIKTRERARTIAATYKVLVGLSKAVKNDRMLSALYACTYVPDFDIQRIIGGATRCADKLLPYSTTEAYLDMLEDIYNFGRKSRIPIKIPAQNAMKERGTVGKKPV